MENIVRELRNVQEKYKNVVTDTFGVRISDMAKDCADAIESLQAELELYKQAEEKREKGCIYCDLDYSIYDEEYGENIGRKYIEYCFRCGKKVR